MAPMDWVEQEQVFIHTHDLDMYILVVSVCLQISYVCSFQLHIFKIYTEA